MQTRILVSTQRREELIDITEKVREKIRSMTIKEGVCHIFVKHATAAITINENYDPKICDDFLDLLREKIPKGRWRHDRIDGNGDAHLKAAIIGPSITIPIKDGDLELGRWQSIMLCEFDGPRRNREIVLTILRANMP